MAALASPLTTGSMYLWEIDLTLSLVAWNLTGLTVTFWWRRPDGSSFIQVATNPSSGKAQYQDVAPQLNMKGTWALSAFVSGYGFTVPQEFSVVAAP